MKSMTLLLTGILLSTSSSIYGQVVAGKTMIAKGNVRAIEPATPDQKRKLKRRSDIFDNEKVITGKNSKAQLRMKDGGLIAMKSDSELVISNYEFSTETGRGSVAMELLKGGLRSVTGSIKAESGDYKLKTPVGSIGIRGTHYEIELVNGDMFIAVWDGAVDVNVDVGSGTETVSFGEGEDFSFGVVSEEGEVTQMLTPPENFQQGHSAQTEEEEDEGDSEDEQQESAAGSEEEQSDEGSEEDSEQSDEQDNSEGESSDEESSEQSDSNNEQNQQDSDTNQENDSTDSEQNENQPADSEPGTQPETTPTPDGDDLDGAGEPQSNEAPSLLDDTGPSDNGEQTPDIAAQPEPQDFEVETESNIEASDISNFAAQEQADFIPVIEEETFLATDAVDNVKDISAAELLVDRSGSLTYSSIEIVGMDSSSGDVTDVALQMSIDLDNGEVKDGFGSFNDPGGEWVFSFEGLISTNAVMELGITSASHGNEAAEGNIDANFSDGIDSIITNIALWEKLEKTSK